MICPKCGAQNMDGVTFCGNCGAQMISHIPPTPEIPQQATIMSSQNYRQQQQFQQPQQQSFSGGQSYLHPQGSLSSGELAPPKNYMTEAIIVTVVSFFCCCSSPISIILGIIAMVKASNVATEFARGNIFEANNNAESAKKLTTWAAIVAVIFVIICWGAYFLFVASLIKNAGGLEEFMKMHS